MNPGLLLQKLIEIERSIGMETDSTLRRKVLEAQECVLRLQAVETPAEQRPAEQRPAEQLGPARFALLRAIAARNPAEQ